MITGLYDVLPVRQTATTSGNASRGHVGRISVGGLVMCSICLSASIALADDAKKDADIRILPATKAPSSYWGPGNDPGAPGRPAKSSGRPDSQVPPSPQPAAAPHAAPAAAPAVPSHKKAYEEGQGQGQLRIVPARRGATSATANAERFEQLYHAIPYSRSAYQVDPMYRQEIALSLLFNRFPPGPTIMAPGPSGMGPRGPMSPGRQGRGLGNPGFGNPMGFGPPMMPPDFVPEF